MPLTKKEEREVAAFWQNAEEAKKIYDAWPAWKKRASKLLFIYRLPLPEKEEKPNA
ncbi:MAG: hypothetical protein WC528_03605 [Patescibacteria group bacterium]